MAVAAAVLLAALLGVGCDDGSPPAQPTAAEANVQAAGGPPSGGIWIGRQELAARPTAGPAWEALRAAADAGCGVPRLEDQDDPANVCVLAQALVFARTGDARYRNPVIAALRSIVERGGYQGRALALARELAAYVIAADLIDLAAADPALDSRFRERLAGLLRAATVDGPGNLVACHEGRPNNWGLNCGATRAAIAAYLGDRAELDRTAIVFRGWLGDRAAYAGFDYGDLSWQCDPARPVGINPPGCTRDGQVIDGVLPDDQRRAGSFRWPPPHEPYVWAALQGAIPLAAILQRAGYDAFGWQDRALLRAAQWLESIGYHAEGDDTWLPHLLNHYYGTAFGAPVPAVPGKNLGWTDWTHGR
jgi:hypothetical protein